MNPDEAHEYLRAEVGPEPSCVDDIRISTARRLMMELGFDSPTHRHIFVFTGDAVQCRFNTHSIVERDLRAALAVFYELTLEWVVSGRGFESYQVKPEEFPSSSGRTMSRISQISERGQ